PVVLEQIRIRGLGVIDDAELELGPGFTAVTGETGAGKTMVLTGLGLLMGGRADAGAVRSGADRAVVEGRVRIDPVGPAAKRAAEAGAEFDDGDLLLSRAVSAEGRSRAYLGGRSVPVGVLAELADDLVAVHGQGDQHRLLGPTRQREALDRFAGAAVTEPLSAYGDRYQRLRTVEAELSEVTARRRERLQEADLLRLGLAEIAQVEPEPGEDVALGAEERRLAHSEGLRQAAVSAHACLTADDTAVDAVDALGLVAAARRSLELQQDHDPALAGLADRLAEVSYLLADVAADLGSYAADVDTDPARLAAVQDRRAVLGALTRKYGDDIGAVLAWADEASRRLHHLDGDDERAASLRGERETLRAELSDLAARVSAARTDAARRFADAVGDELRALAMPNARLVVEVRRRTDPDGLVVDGQAVAFGPAGIDEVEILFAAHAGATPRPLDRGASGGELSRLMLAVEVVFAGADPVPTFVFDEVDAGVGGKAAVEVGRRLARLARTAQVVVVTHLPQVAAFADRHLQVVKTEDGRVTSSGVVALDGTGRVVELSRMLAGLEGSATARAHAEELLAAAASSRAGRR
ncbi:MAG TPA: DNA repair protein RecN, partial [Jiangellaceae bacterium]|nr:DNA repair protein RecN [Jiangellaceae bacterium]